jgi:hypothetical protein
VKYRLPTGDERRAAAVANRLSAVGQQFQQYLFVASLIRGEIERRLLGKLRSRTEGLLGQVEEGLNTGHASPAAEQPHRVV